MSGSGVRFVRPVCVYPVYCVSGLWNSVVRYPAELDHHTSGTLLIHASSAPEKGWHHSLLQMGNQILRGISVL